MLRYSISGIALAICNLIAIYIPATPVSAQQLMPVYVAFQWPTVVPSDDQREIDAEILTILANEYHFWRFQAGDDKYPRLAVSIRNHSSWILQMHLITAEGVIERWSATLFPEGELSLNGYPLPGKWAPEIKDCFLNELIEKNRQKIRDQLLALPLSRNVLTNPKLPKHCFILPLPWEACAPLAISLFKIQARIPQEGVVFVHSQGRGQPIACTGPPPFNGIMIEHETWDVPSHPVEAIERHLTDLARAKVEFVYLETLKGWQAPETQLSIAPPGQ